MRFVLSIDTHSPQGSVALQAGTTFLSASLGGVPVEGPVEATVDVHRTDNSAAIVGAGAKMSECLLPTIHDLLQQAFPTTDVSFSMRDCAAIVCTQGPGSFTSVRLGLAVMQGLAYPYQTPCIGVPSLLTLAYQGWCESLDKSRSVCSVMDARMGQVYWAVYRFTASQIEEQQAPSLARADIFVAPTGTFVYGLNACGEAVEMAVGVDGHQRAAAKQLELAQRYDLPQRSAHEIDALYVRNQVAQTVAERAASRSATSSSPR